MVFWALAVLIGWQEPDYQVTAVPEVVQVKVAAAWVGAQREQKVKFVARSLARYVQSMGPDCLQLPEAALTAIRQTGRSKDSQRLQNLAPFVPVPWASLPEAPIANVPILVSPKSDRRLQRVVGYLDGHTARVSEHEWQSMIRSVGGPVEGLETLTVNAERYVPNLAKRIQAELEAQSLSAMADTATSFLDYLKSMQEDKVRSLWWAIDDYVEANHETYPSAETFADLLRRLQPYLGDRATTDPLMGAEFRWNKGLSGRGRGSEPDGTYVLASPITWLDGTVAVVDRSGKSKSVPTSVLKSSSTSFTKADSSKDAAATAFLKILRQQLKGIAMTDLRALSAAFSSLVPVAETALPKDSKLTAEIRSTAAQATEASKLPLAAIALFDPSTIDTFHSSKNESLKQLTLVYLRQIALAVVAYQSDNGGKFPAGRDNASWQKALLPNMKDEAGFVSPWSEEPFMFRLDVDGKSALPMDSSEPVAYDPGTFPDGSHAVAFGDGSVRTVSEVEFTKIAVLFGPGVVPEAERSKAVLDGVRRVKELLQSKQEADAFESALSCLSLAKGAGKSYLIREASFVAQLAAMSFSNADAMIRSLARLKESGADDDPSITAFQAVAMIQDGQIAEAASLLAESEPKLMERSIDDNGFRAWIFTYQIRLSVLEGLGRLDELTQTARRGSGFSARRLRDNYRFGLESLVGGDPDYDEEAVTLICRGAAVLPVLEKWSKSWTPSDTMADLQTLSGKLGGKDAQDMGSLMANIQIAIASGDGKGALEMIDEVMKTGIAGSAPLAKRGMTLMRVQALLQMGRNDEALKELGPAPAPGAPFNIRQGHWHLAVMALHKLGRQNDAEQGCRHLAKAVEDGMGKVFAESNDRDMSRFSSQARSDLGLVISVLEESHDPGFVEFVAETAINLKSAAFEVQVIRQRVKQSAIEDAELGSLLSRFEALSRLAQSDASDVSERALSAVSLEINRKLTSLGVSAAPKHVTISEVRKAMKGDEAAIEVLQAQTFDRSANPLPGSYYAFVVRRERVSFVRLGDTTSIDSRIIRLRGSLESGGDVRGAESTAPKPGSAVEALKSVRTTVWDPLKEHCKGATQLILAADGALLAMPWSVLSVGSELSNPPVFRVLPSLRDLVGRAGAKGSTEGVLIAGVDYGQGDGPWRRLPGTEKEGAAVAPKLFQLTSGSVETLTGSAASEERFRRLRSPKYVHIATHGFYFPRASGKGIQTTKDDSRSGPSGLAGVRLADEPLLRSGFVLAGANGLELGSDPSNDGLVTALDIALQDFSGTQLVVLSACESGLGDVVNGDGVFGLQRAFLQAGAKNLVISLFPIPDSATCDLMTRFYGHLAEGLAPANALHESQVEIAALPSSVARDWAGFIVVGR